MIKHLQCLINRTCENFEIKSIRYMIWTELDNAHPAFGGSMDTVGGRSIFWAVWCTGVVESDFFSCLGGFICKTCSQSFIRLFMSYPFLVSTKFGVKNWKWNCVFMNQCVLCMSRKRSMWPMWPVSVITYIEAWMRMRNAADLHL